MILVQRLLGVSPAKKTWAMGLLAFEALGLKRQEQI